ncbi:MAG: tetraacyldisaccharide 4'-kinase, partial [Proteobacteria bacterium]|nr:tetraacyldisaccharide 4'-kinase [Pseudomonadota bacterium]
AHKLLPAAAAPGPAVFHGRLQPDPAAVATLRGDTFLAFAGIADPGKFFATLAAANIDAPERVAFADHHRYRAADAARLLARADRAGLTLLTTEKDHARMHGEPGLAELCRRTKVLPVALAVDEDVELRKRILSVLGKRTPAPSASGDAISRQAGTASF